ncbi:hypothetical protein D3C72_2375320 [compost metagenome]
MNTEDNTGPDSILGVFETKKEAKGFVADYVLANDISTEWLFLAGKKITRIEGVN